MIIIISAIAAITGINFLMLCVAFNDIDKLKKKADVHHDKIAELFRIKQPKKEKKRRSDHAGEN